MGARRVTRGRKPPVEQTPRERLIKGNKRIIAPSGKTTWAIKAGVK